MHNLSLNGAWQVRQAGTEDWLPAAVPGCIHTDLLTQGRIPDPFVGENEKQVQWVARSDWEYRRSFTVDNALMNTERIDLVCAGLDTLADIYINNHFIGRSGNIFRTYRFNVKSALQNGENTISIRFQSPYTYIEGRQKVRKLPTIMNGGMAHLRKVQSHFGWDWGPTLPSMGIWKDISLQGLSGARISNAGVRQEHNPENVTLTVDLEAEVLSARSLACRLTLTAPNGSQREVLSQAFTRQTSLKVTIDDPQLWWPNGLGAQPLYQVELELLSGEKTLDRRVYEIGLRTLELRRQPDPWGESFTFVVNGVPVFAKGANWIPADSFITRLSAAHLEHLIGSAVTANMNMLRVWGGGYYESDAFYALCDRYGILIWQDFGFACAPYPLDEADFLENVHHEVIDNVRRLRQHACLALWCGNNELEMMWPKWKNNTALTQAYQDFFHDQLKTWVAAEDPATPYWYSSPSSGSFMQETNGDARGDTHLWQVWHGLEPFSYFQKRYTRFCSEFGLESLPDMNSIAAFAKPEEYDLRSKVMLHHQRCPSGNEKMAYYLRGRFRFPQRFEDLVYLTQVSQAECMRTGVEHWRRNFPRCSGALYWQLNDCWPVSSWASIDYHGRWKALQYAARRFFAPLALSCLLNKDQIEIYLTNDSPTAWQGELRWSLESLDGQVYQSADLPAGVIGLTSAQIGVIDTGAQLRTHPKTNLLLVVELWQKDNLLDRQCVPFNDEKDLSLPDPQLQAEVSRHGGRLQIQLSAAAWARFVEIRLAGQDVVFSDNFFDIPAGRSKTVTCALPAGLTLQQAQENLRLRSLADVKSDESPFSAGFKRLLTELKPENIASRIMFRLMK